MTAIEEFECSPNPASATIEEANTNEDAARLCIQG